MWGVVVGGQEKMRLHTLSLLYFAGSCKLGKLDKFGSFPQSGGEP